MSGQYMRKLMEAVLTEQHGFVDLTKDLEQTIEYLENNRNELIQFIIDNRADYPGKQQEVQREFKSELNRYKKALERWNTILSNAEPLNVVPINPMNKKSSKTLGGGSADVGIQGSANEVMNWLQTYMPQKHKAIAENLRTLERKSPEPITWEEGVADIMAVRPNRFPHGKFTRTELPPNPGAKVLIVGETPNGDDVRFVFYQGTTGEGSHKAAIVNGKEIIGSGFADVLQEL